MMLLMFSSDYCFGCIIDISMNALRSDQRGFTLVEILVALIVGGILVTAITTIATTQSHLSQRTRDAAVSGAFAEARIESIRSAGFLTLTDGSTDITNELPDELKSPRSATVTVNSPSSGIKRVVLTITYNDQGDSRTDSYTTFVGELGVGQY